jgi:RNA polymerase sigma factor (TIGR02999 family)
MSDVTSILSQIEQGDPQAAEKLLPLVYDELRKLAAAKLAHEKPGQTLQATALVHEVYLRLVAGGDRKSELEGQESAKWDGRGHFFAAAAEAMRRILIDLARQKRTARQGGERKRCELSDADRVILPISDELLDLDEALNRLDAVDPQAAQLVKLRIFAGMTVEEAAAALGFSPRTAKRNWAYARAWLGRDLGAGAQQED